MPSISGNIKKRMEDNPLLKELPGNMDLQGAAKKAGVPATAVSPQGAVQQGASLDAAKMVGTTAAEKAQVEGVPPVQEGAVNAQGQTQEQQAGLTPPPVPGTEAAAPQPTFQPTAEGGQPQTLKGYEQQRANTAVGQTVEQAADAERKAKMSASFGDTGLIVADLVSAAIKDQAKNPTITAAYKMPQAADIAADSRLQGLSPENQEKAKDALQALASNPTDTATVENAQRILSSLGVADAMDPLKYLTQVQTASALAAAAPDQLKLTPQMMEAAGITPEELQLLGIDPAQAGNMTVSQLRQAIDEAGMKEGEVADLRNQLRQPGLGDQEKEDIRRQLQALGASGMTANEAALGAAISEATKGETVEIDGVEYNAEDLLNDKNFATIAQQYLDADEGDPIRKEIEAVLPGFGQWAKDNDAALKDMVQKAGTTYQQVRAGQDAKNKIVGTITTQGGINEDQAYALINDLTGGNMDKFTSGALDVSNSGILSILADPEKAGKAGVPIATVLPKLIELKNSDPEVLKAFAAMTPQELEASGLLKDPDAWDSFTKATQYKSMSPDEVAKDLFGMSNLAAVFNNFQALEATGDIPEGMSYDTFKDIFDANKDGKMDDQGTVKQRLAARFGGKEAVEFAKTGRGLDVLGSMKGANKEVSPTVKKVGDLLADGDLSDEDIASISGEMSQIPLKALHKMEGAKHVSPEAQKRIAGAINTVQTKQTQEAVKQLPQGPERFKGLTDMAANAAANEYKDIVITNDFMDTLRGYKAGDGTVPDRDTWPKGVQQAADQATNKLIGGANKKALIHHYESYLKGEAEAWVNPEIIATALRRLGQDPDAIGKPKKKTGGQKLAHEVSKAGDAVKLINPTVGQAIKVGAGKAEGWKI